MSRALDGRGKWVPCPEGLPHHLDKRHSRDRRYLHPDIPEDVVVAVLWCEPSAATRIPPFWLPSVWMNGRFINIDHGCAQERGAMKVALDEYKVNLPSPPARSLPSTWK